MAQMFKRCNVCGALIVGLDDKLHARWHNTNAPEYVKVKYDIVIIPSDDVAHGAE